MASRNQTVEALRRRARLQPESPGPTPSKNGKHVQIFSAAELLATEFPEPKWAIQGILPAGFNILAGKPKLGKSWLAMNFALGIANGKVALGKINVEQGRVLYVALEDTKRRLKSRLEKLLSKQQGGAPGLLELAPEWPRQDSGGIAYLTEWCQHHKDGRLVIIDTWAKFRPPLARGVNEYEQDYQMGTAIKSTADACDISVLVLHHCRKAGAIDPLDEVSGTLGFVGCADGVMVMRRERGQHDASLFVTGRDVEEQDIALQWNGEYALWTMLGQADEYRISRERADVRELFKKEGRLSPKEAAPLLGKKENACKQLFWRMAKDGWLKNVGDGKYELAPGEE
jgi:hypothetical protein